MVLSHNPGTRNDGYFRDFCVIGITGFPNGTSAVLPVEAASPILLICEEAHLSAELLLSTFGEKNAVEVLLLLRLREKMGKASAEQSHKALENGVQRVLEQLNGLGFTARPIDNQQLSDPKAPFPPLGCFGSSLSAKVKGFMACPPYRFIKDGGRSFFAFGGKADDGGASGVYKTVLKVGELLKLMDYFPRSLISLQANIMFPPAAYFENLIQPYIKSSLKELADTRERIGHFIEQSTAGDALFDVRIMVLGTEEAFLKKAAYFFEKEKFTCAAVPGLQAFLSTRRYPLYGAENTFAAMNGIAGDRKIPVNYRPYLQFSRVLTNYELMQWLRLPNENLIDTAVMALSDSSGIYLGSSYEKKLPLYLPRKSMIHGIITGKSGSGKTNFAMGLLIEAAKKGMNFLAIEPVKREYRNLTRTEMAKRGLRVYTPGNNGASPMPMNIFMPPKGVTAGTYIGELKSIFAFAFSGTALLMNILPTVLRQCYTAYGWRDSDTRESAGVRPFGMHEFLIEYRRYIRETVLNPEDRNTLENSGLLRYQSLLSDDPLMFDTIEAPDYDALIDHPTVIELDAISNSEEKALVTALLIRNLRLTLLRRGRKSLPGNIIFIDEAHVLLSPGGKPMMEGAADTSGAAMELLRDMVNEMRAYGVCMLFGDQHAAKLPRDISGGVSLKMMMLADDRHDLDVLRDVGQMDAKMLGQIKSLGVGEGFFRADIRGVEKPIRIRADNSEEKYAIPQSTGDEAIFSYMKPKALPPFPQCAGCTACDARMREEARFYADQLARAAAAKMQKKELRSLPDYLWNGGALEKDLRALMEKKGSGFGLTAQLLHCVRIHLIRTLALMSGCELSEEELFRRPAPSAPGTAYRLSEEERRRFKKLRDMQDDRPE